MENSDLIMRALQSHALHLEGELADRAEELELARCESFNRGESLNEIARFLELDWTNTRDYGTAIIEELKRRGVMNGGAKP